MIKVIFVFLMLTGLSYLAIKATEKMTAEQLLMLTKFATYFIIAGSIAFAALLGIVYLF